jgi:hypothetical protein
MKSFSEKIHSGGVVLSYGFCISLLQIYVCNGFTTPSNNVPLSTVSPQFMSRLNSSGGGGNSRFDGMMSGSSIPQGTRSRGNRGEQYNPGDQSWKYTQHFFDEMEKGSGKDYRWIVPLEEAPVSEQFK